MQIFQSAVQKLSLYPTRGKRTKINYRNSVAQYLALVKKYHLYIVSFCHWKWLAQKNSSKGTGFAEIWPPSPIYRAYRHGMGFRSRSARSFCTLTSPITFSIGVIQGSWIVCDDCMEHAHDWNAAQQLPENTRRNAPAQEMAFGRDTTLPDEFEWLHCFCWKPSSTNSKGYM